MSPRKLNDYQKRGVGVLVGGAFVLSSIKEAALEQIAKADFSRTEWDPHPRIINVRSKRRGSQARFGWVSVDGAWLRYPSFPPSYGSVEVFNADVEHPGNTVTRLLSSIPVKVVKATDRTTLKEGVGFLLDSEDAKHNTLVVAREGNLHLIPFELDPPPHGAHEHGVVYDAADGEASAARAYLTEVAERSCFSEDPRDIRNIRLSFRFA